jgi:hypothetical protein
MITPRRLSLLLAVAGLLIAVAAADAVTAQRLDVPKTFTRVLPTVRTRTAVPVRIPKYVYFAAKHRVFPAGAGTRNAYTLSMGFANNCNGANACFAGDFTGRRGGSLAFRRKVALTGGHTGSFKPTTCGGSCSPPEIDWIQNGYRYSIQIKDLAGPSERAALIQLANQAIRRPPLL